MTDHPFPSSEQLLADLRRAGAPLIDVLMATLIGASDHPDADKALLWLLHDMVTDFASEDTATWDAAEALSARMAATREARSRGASDDERLMAETRHAVYDAPLEVFLATMSLLRSDAVALEHVHRRRRARNGQDLRP
jgi:hypothetical protein